MQILFLRKPQRSWTQTLAFESLAFLPQDMIVKAREECRQLGTAGWHSPIKAHQIKKTPQSDGLADNGILQNQTAVEYF